MVYKNAFGIHTQDPVFHHEVQMIFLKGQNRQVFELEDHMRRRDREALKWCNKIDSVLLFEAPTVQPVKVCHKVPTFIYGLELIIQTLNLYISAKNKLLLFKLILFA